MKKGWSTGKIVGVTLGGIAASLVLGISFVISVYQLSYFFEKMDQKSRSRYDRVLEENSGQERKEDDFSEGQKEPDEEETEDFGGYSSQPDGEYYDFTNDIRSDLSYQVEFRSFLKNDFVTREGAGAAVMEYSYPQISGDAKNLDGINDALQEELRIVEEHIASSVDYLTGDEEYRFEGVGYVTYMSEKILSVIYVEYGYLNGSYLESYVVSYNVDMETGMLMNNTHLLAVDDNFSVDFRKRCELQNGVIENLDYMSDQEITYYLTDSDYLIIFYTPLGIEVGFNYYDGWVTVTYRDYEKYQKKFYGHAPG